MKHFLDLASCTSDELASLLDLALQLKDEWRDGGNRPVLQNKTLGMIFQKPSLRTRVSFEMAMKHLGGSAIMLGSAGDRAWQTRERAGCRARIVQLCGRDHGESL